MRVNFVKGIAIASVLGLAAVAGSAVVAAQGDDAALKGVYREGKRTGVKVSVFRGSGSSRRRVASDFEFKSKDAFELDLETNQKSYVYVLNRTIDGDPNQLSSKGIERVRDDDRRERQGSRQRYTLLYPKGGDAKTTSTANKPFTISGFSMDENPGVEKMLVVVSTKPIDLNKYFDLTNGNQREDRRRADSGRRTDSEDDVLDQLNKDLADWASNAETSLPKGVSRDPEGVGIIRDAAKPAMVELTLRHYAK